jgi:ubiquinone/menaquinone biosynthesis C-methylase UbiE
VPSSFEGDLVVADACTLPFNDQSFDAVLMIHVLGHVSDPDRRLIANESMRVVKENGKVYFRGFARGDFRCGTGTETEPGTYRRGTGIITHYFCETEIIDLFSPLKKETIKTSQWCMRVRGKELKREEVDAVFTKKCRSCKNSKSFIRVNTNVPL